MSRGTIFQFALQYAFRVA